MRFTHKRLMLLTAGALIALLGTPLLAQVEGDGEPLWRAVTGGGFSGPPVIGPDGRVFAAADDRYLYAYTSDGRALWRYDLRRRASGGMCVTGDGLVLVEREDGVLVAVNPAGKAAWNRAGGAVHTAVLCDPSGLVLRLEEGTELVALAPRGMPVWRVRLPASVVAGPIRAAGRIIVGLETGEVSIYDRSGTPRYVATLPVEPTALSVSAGGSVLAGGADGRVFEVHGAEVVRSWRPGDTAVRRLLPTGAPDLPRAGYALVPGGAVFRLLRRPVGEQAPDESLSRPMPVPGAGAAADGSDRAPITALLSVLDDGQAVLALSADGAVYEIRGDGFHSVASPGPRLGGARGQAFAAVDGRGRAVIAGPSWTISAWDVPPPALNRTGRIRFADERERSAEIDRIYLARLLGSSVVSEQQRALAEIEERVAAGELAESYEHIVAALLEFVGTPVGEVGAGTPGARAAGLEEQVRAVRLLSRIGGYGVRNTLLGRARSTDERELRIAVLESLAVLPADGEGRTARTIRGILREEARRDPDARLGRAAIQAVRGYVAYRGGIDDPALAEALGILASGGFPPAVVEEVAALAGELY